MINEKILGDLTEKVSKLTRRAVRLRIGEVVNDTPLSVTLGGSDKPYTDVQSIGTVSVGDRVVVLLAGNDMVVLGPPTGIADPGGGSTPPYIENIGDGSTTAFTVTHNLDSDDVDVTVIRNSDGKFVLVETEISMASPNNQIIVRFALPPSNNQFRVIVRK